jgi:outer membrane receptor protein involved in Fe transport
MNSLKKIILAVSVFIVFFTVPLWSGTTGKITGTVVDKTNNEPLIGANVVVLGTSFGAVTDIDGNYTILFVPPGTYTVQVSFIGYRKSLINDVRVFIDQTARVDVQLESQAIETNDVIVVAERMPVKPDVATSVVDVSIEEVMNLPATNVQDVLQMQAGIKDGRIRGSEMDQSLFLLDGVTMRDPRNNQAITKVALSSVKEISIERGGFNAEYGQVQSGLSKVVTKEGKNYSVAVAVQISPPAPKYYRGDGIPDVHDKNSFWMRSYFDQAVCWTGTTTPIEAGGWDEYTRDKYPSFVGWNEISKQLMSDSDPKNDLTPLGAQRAFEYETRRGQITDQPDYTIDAGFGGPVPIISSMLGNLRFFASYRAQRDMLLFPQSRPDYSDYDGRLLVTSDIAKNMTLHVSGLYGNIATMEENWNKGEYPHYPNEIADGTGGSQLFNMFSDWTYSLTDIDHRALSAKVTHALSSKTLYEVSIEYFRRHYFSRPPGARDASIMTEVVPGFYESTNPLGYYPQASSSDGIIVYAGEQHSLARDNSYASATTIKADFTSQIDFSNELKMGVEFVYNDLNLDYGYIQMQTSGNSYASRVQMENNPVRGAAYVQDKLETQGFTLNAGLRLDYSNANVDWWAFDPYNAKFYGDKYNDKLAFEMTSPKGQWQLSPRLGISHPITENSKLYFNYGHFKQMPQYEAAFRVDRRPDNTLARIGDPNVTLAKTISYELGYDHQLFEGDLLVQLTAFYRDISDQSNQTNYYPLFGRQYSRTTSNSYSDIRGLEFTLRKSPGPWFYGFANFTYQATSNGVFGINRQYEDPALQTSYEDNIANVNNIYQSKYVPTPFARANLIFSTPQDFGPSMLGQNILGDFILSFLFNWSQGGWTTYNPQNAPGVANNVQYVDYFDATLRASKSFVFKRLNIQLFVDISNLFNTLRLSNTGGQSYRESLHLPKSDAYLNIPGDDKFGDYRKPGVEWQPMEYQNSMDQTIKTVGSTRAVYYEASTGKYWEYIHDPSITRIQDRWKIVDQARIDRILEDKAYIDMPNQSTFWFLNPRNITYGLRVSFDLD